jgi:hypothetical protein
MISELQNAQVVRYLRRHCGRPGVALRLWAHCLDHLHRETGEIMLSRDDIAKELGASVDCISFVMTALVECGAVIRQRQRLPGTQGPGRMRYFIDMSVGLDS